MRAGEADQSENRSDEQLVGQLASGQQEALGPLYSRYASLIFNLASQSLDAGAAEEIVQDVFLTVWRKASAFDPAQGAFRPWVLQIAHYRILNELRHRRRRPQLQSDPEGHYLSAVPDPAPEPAEAAWHEFEQSTVRDAVGRLTPPQRQALGLAYFEDLTHEQVARTLDIPLGTAKTRIRAGMQVLRHQLAPLLAALVLLLAAGLALVGLRGQAEQATLARTERALALVTSSDVQPQRLEPIGDAPLAAHGNYRGRPGTPLAVVTLSALPPLGPDEVYQVWAEQAGRWVSLGTTRVDGSGAALLIADGLSTSDAPTRLQVTRERAAGSEQPTGPAVVQWPQAGTPRSDH